MTIDAPKKKILFVCTGNICRSAMAEHLLRHLSATRGLAVETASAGVAAESYYQVPDIARKLLAAEGVPPFEHKPRLATREVMRWADLILVMTQGHRDHIVDLYPEFTAKTRLMREHAGFGEKDVDDPMSRPDEVFVRCLAVLKESLEVLISRDWRGPDDER